MTGNGSGTWNGAEVLDRSPARAVRLALLVGAGLILAACLPGTPQSVPPRGSLVPLVALRAGDCIDVRDTGIPDDRVGSDAQVIAAVAAGKSRQARCDTPHSHEVAGITDFQQPGPYPGPEVLIAGATPVCMADAADYLGGPLDGSPFALVIAVPDPDAWAGGDRRAVCLVHRVDLALSAVPMKAGTAPS